MKKIIAVILSVMMLLCAASALAVGTDTSKTTIGTISINGAFRLQCDMPEGFKLIPIAADADTVLAIIKSDDKNLPIMQLSLAFDEKYYDVDRLNDLPQEELEALEATYYDEDPEVNIDYRETGYGTLLLVAHHDTEELDYISFFSIYKGYCVEFVLIPGQEAEDKNLSEQQIESCLYFLTELDFVPVTHGGVTKDMLAGEEWPANLNDYDSDIGGLTVNVRRVIELDPSVLEIEAGETLNIGSEKVKVETVEKNEDGVLVNGEISLREENDVVVAYMYEHKYMETIASIIMHISDDVVFLDDIDPQTGEILDEPTVHTATEFIEMIQAGTYPDFESDNVDVLFDENAEIKQIHRHYTPWQ